MKILFFIGDMDHTGGTERVLACIAGGLAQRGYGVEILSMYAGFMPVFSPGKSVVLHSLGKDYPKGPADHLRNVAGVWRLAAERRPDVLVLVDVILMLYAFPLALGGRCRVIGWEHFNYYYRFRKNNRLRRAAIRMAVCLSDAYVVLSDEDKAYYGAHFRKCGHIRRIYNPAPFDSVAVSDGKRKRVVLAAGRLERVKGFDLLLDSWKRIEGRFPGWSLVIAGEGGEQSHLEEQIRREGLRQVKLAGRQEDMERLYRTASVFALPSRYEGFGMVLLEAMEYGIPVVSYACPAGPSEIVTDGKDGFLVKPGDRKAFAGRLEELMRDPGRAERMGREGKRAAGRFGLEGILDQWELLLQETVERKADNPKQADCRKAW